MDSGAINLRKKEISDKHEEWLREARKYAEWCLEACHGVASPEQKVRALVSEVSLSERFGAPPDNFDLKVGDHDYEKWYLNLWGRRCSYYISNLALGLRAAASIQHGDTELGDLVLRFEHLELSLSERFKRRWEAGATPEQSLLSRGDIANFHVTYLDPILFSALYILYRNRRDKCTWGDRANQTLWRVIKDEVLKSTTHGSGKSPQIKDESTVWWGFKELVKREKASFALISRSKHTGWREVVRTCRNLIRSNNGIIRFPRPEETLYEATPEIYGEPRTRILIAFNCIELASVLPRSPRKWICSELTDFANEQFTNVFNDSLIIKRHIGLLGLGLQLTARAQLYLQTSCSAEWQDIANSSTSREVQRAGLGDQNDTHVLYFCYKPNKNPPDAPDPLARARKRNYDIFIDHHRVWIQPPDENEAIEIDLHPDQLKLLSLLLKYRGREMDATDFSIRLGQAPKPGMTESEITQALAVRLCRFRKKMKTWFTDKIFRFPKKVKGRGYCCAGSFRSCLIIPTEAEHEYRVKTLSQP